MKQKGLKYYMELPYKIEIKRIPESEGGGYVATMPELGRFTLAGDGDIPEEAIKNLNEIKEIMFKEWLEQGVSIPEPEDEPPLTEYSGKFVVRLPRYLHQELSQNAKKNGVSLNLYVVSLLASRLEEKKIFRTINELVLEMKNLNKNVFALKGKLIDQTSIDLKHININLKEDHEYSTAA